MFCCIWLSCVIQYIFRSDCMVTLKDIAKELNISISTVSGAISGKGCVGEELCVKIAELAKRLIVLKPSLVLRVTC